MAKCEYCTKTVKERFDTIGKEFSLNCEYRINAMNDVLQLLWADIFDFRSNQDVVSFSGNGLQTVTTEFPIYGVEGFYAKKGTCGDSNLVYPLDNTCGYMCGSEKYEGLYMYNVGSAYETLDSCQFSYCPDTKEISFNAPSGIDGGFIKYYKGFDLITKQSDCIPIQPSWFPALKMLMKVYYYEKAGTVYEGDDNKFDAKYDRFIAKMKERDAIKVRFLKNLSSKMI